MGGASARAAASSLPRTWLGAGHAVRQQPSRFRGERGSRKNGASDHKSDSSALDAPEFSIAACAALLHLPPLDTGGFHETRLARARLDGRSTRDPASEPLACHTGPETNPPDLFQLAFSAAC